MAGEFMVVAWVEVEVEGKGRGLARRAGENWPGGGKPWLRQAGGAGACADLPQFLLQQLRGGLCRVLSKEAAAAQLLQKITDRRRHREGDLHGIDTVLLARHFELIMA